MEGARVRALDCIAINDKNLTKRLFFQFLLAFFAYSTRVQQYIAIILTTGGPGSPQFNFYLVIQMHSQGKIEDFYPKIATSGPHLTF